MLFKRLKDYYTHLLFKYILIESTSAVHIKNDAVWNE